MDRRIGLAAILIGLALLCRFDGRVVAGARPARARELITRPIDENRRVLLAGNTRPEARPEHNRGRVPPDFAMEHLLLQLRRPPELQQEFDEYVEGLNQGSSANFHKWLEPAEVGEQYGLSDSDLRKIERWLGSHRIRVNYVYPNRVLMDISATARQLREAMKVEIHFLEVNGERHYANVNDPQIPEALAPAVAGIVALHDFRPHPMVHRMVQPAYTDPNGNYLVTPGDLAAIYNLNPLFNQGITGKNQTIVLVEDSDPFTTADWSTFETEFKLTQYGGSLNVTHPNLGGNCTDPHANGDDVEVALDMEYASAAAPGAPIVVAACANLFAAVVNVIEAVPHPYIMSISYGECEPALGAAANAFISSTYQTAVSEGISVFVSSGDQGPASCDAGGPGATATNGINVSGLATTPFNVAVGGTDFGDFFAGTQATYWGATNSAVLESAIGYIPEIPWNSSCASVDIATIFGGTAVTYGSGGGFCGTGFGANFQTIASGSGGPSGCATGMPTTANQVSGTCAGYLKPAWQSGLFGNPNDGVRDIPDVSLFAANGAWFHFYVFCDSDTIRGGHSCVGTPNPAAGGPWSGAGGTSFAAPILAGIQALVNQRTAALTIAPTPGQGNPNTVYYAIAKSEFGAGGNARCNSSTQPLPRRGQQTTCVFYDVTQGDNNVNCNFGTSNCFGATPGNSDGILSTGAISGLSIPAGGGGSGYSTAPACSISLPHNTAYNGYTGGVQATCTATVSGGKVTSVSVVNPGSGYAPLPVCTLTGGGGSGAVCLVAGITATDYEAAFPATVGWDFATGIGTINAYNLVYSQVWAQGP